MVWSNLVYYNIKSETSYIYDEHLGSKSKSGVSLIVMYEFMLLIIIHQNFKKMSFEFPKSAKP